MCKPVSPHPRQWEIPICNAYARWALFQISFRPQQKIEAKLGGGWKINSEPSFARLQYYFKGLEARPEGRSLTTPTTAPSCASRSNKVLTGYRKLTISQKPHTFHKAKMHTTPSQPFRHTAHTRAHLISCVGRATPPPHNHTHFTPSLTILRPHSPQNHTGVVCLINCHGLTFDLPPRPQKHEGVEVHNMQKYQQTVT